MVLMNYHELTMGEARDSPGRRKQFLVICGVMAAAFIYSTITAGAWSPLKIEVDQTFPGGTFVYKSNKRDYAAAGSLERHIATDFGYEEGKDIPDTVYSIFLDNHAKVNDGRRTRFASGILLTKNNPAIKDLTARKKTLLASNSSVEPVTRSQLLELPATDLWPRLKYKETKLPSTKVHRVHFPFTNGFVSSLLLEYRILPALRESINDPGAVIFSTCSIKESACTHYATTNTAYLLGQPNTVAYQASLPPPRPLLTMEDVDRMMGQTGVGQYFGFGKNQDGAADEL